MMARYSVQEIVRRVQSEKDGIETLSEFLPCYMHINSLQDFSLLETDRSLLNHFQMDMESIKAGGFALLEKVVHPQDLANAVKVNQEYLENSSEQSHVSFFQRIVFPETGKEQFYFTRGKVLDADRILNISIPLQDSELFNHRVFDLYENANFIRGNIHKFNLLTEREVTVCKLLCEDATLQSVADKLGVSKHTVKNHKTNIYRKLEVRNYFEFYFFAQRFKLQH